MKKQLWGIFILTVLAFSAFSAETVRIKPLSEKITIDGKLSEKIDFITVKTSAWHPSIIKQSSRNLENLH